MIKKYLTWNDFFELLIPVQDKITTDDIVFGIPKGGMIVSNFLECKKTHDPNEATVIVDDIVDSGRTKKLHTENFPKARFITVVDKQVGTKYDGYIVFPWEEAEEDAEHTVAKMIEHLGDNPTREGLLDTPKRVVKSWKTLYGGYNQKPEEVLKTNFSVACDEMIISKDIEFYSTCEHHMLPFFGKAHIAYIPRSNVVGLSKLSRLLEVYARRLQIQERLTNQIADGIMNVMNPLGAGVIIEAKHFCMVCRGVQKKNSTMITSAIRGLFKSAEVKNEFHNLCK
jgi:GTP cyclohydrolase IA